MARENEANLRQRVQSVQDAADKQVEVVRKQLAQREDELARLRQEFLQKMDNLKDRERSLGLESGE